MRNQTERTITSVRHKRVLPGFGLSLGFTMFYVSAIVLIPLSTLLFQPFQKGFEHFFATVSHPQVLKAFEVSLSTALGASLFNVLIGVVITWTLVRYRFFGRRILDALVDLPFALPTAVAGIALSTLFSPNAWLGSLLQQIGITVVNTSTGISLAMVFIGFPFVVRTVQPVLEALEPEVEEAAHSLGANKLQIFGRIILPRIFPAVLTGFTLSFARALGEYGSVIFIAGNLPYKTEIVPLRIIAELEQYDYAGAASLALVMLLVSFTLILVLNIVQDKVSKRFGGGI